MTAPHRHASLLLALAVACTTTPDESPDASTPADAGPSDAGPADAGHDSSILPTDPSLEELVAWWNTHLACRLFACEHRVRQTPETCAHALNAHGIPYDTFRNALASVQAGRASADTAALRRCAGFLRTVPLSGDCFGDDVVPYRDAYGPQFLTFCADLLTGSVTPGGPCDSDLECANGGTCAFDRNTECTDECVVWLASGADCSDQPRDCSPTSYCDGETCVARNLSPDGASCFDDGTSCRSGKCFDFQCRTQSPYDGECVDPDDCQSGLYCRPLPPSTGKLGICQYPVLAGAKCGYTIQCAGSQPCDGYFQKYVGGWTEGTCGGEPNDLDDPCTPIADGYDFGDTGCFADLYCNPATSTCTEAPAIGAPCTAPDKRCGFLAYCDADNTCRAKKPAGAAAASRVECLDDFDSFGMKCFRRADRDRCNVF